MFLDQEKTKAATEMLEATHQEIMVLKTRLDVIQVKYENAEKEIEGYIPQIQDLERFISEFRSAAYAKDEELIAAYNQSSIGEVVGEVGAQARAAEGKEPEDAATENIKAAEGVTTE
ncbi:hypothetical protein ACFX1S_010667 [Malus domestica]